MVFYVPAVTSRGSTVPVYSCNSCTLYRLDGTLYQDPRYSFAMVCPSCSETACSEHWIGGLGVCLSCALKARP